VKKTAGIPSNHVPITGGDWTYTDDTLDCYTY
jgi:hypothetical protein